MTQDEIIEILNKYQSKTPPLHDEGCIDPMDFHKIADEIAKQDDSQSMQTAGSIEEEILEIIKEESEKADVRKFTCVNGFGYSQFERNLAKAISNRLEKQISYKEAYKYAMKALTHYIISSREKMVEAEKKGDKEAQEHYRLKVKFMRTAQKTIRSKLELYLYLASEK